MQSENVLKVYGLVAPLYEQGKILAAHITGQQTDGYHGSATFTSLKVSGYNHPRASRALIRTV